MNELASAQHEQKISSVVPEHLRPIFGNLAITHTSHGQEYIYQRDEQGHKVKRLKDRDIPWEELDESIEETYSHDIGARVEYNRAWAVMKTPDGNPSKQWGEWEQGFLEEYRSEHPISGVKVENGADLALENERLRSELQEKIRENKKLGEELEDLRLKVSTMQRIQSEMEDRIAGLERQLQDPSPTAPKTAVRTKPVDTIPDKTLEADSRTEFMHVREDLRPAFGEEKLDNLAEGAVDIHDGWSEDIESAETEEEKQRRASVAKEEIEHINDAIVRHEILLLSDDKKAELPPEPEASLKRYLELAPEVFEKESNLNSINARERLKQKIESLRTPRQKQPRYATVTLPEGRRVRVSEEYIEYDHSEERGRGVIMVAALGAAALAGAALTAAIIYGSHKSGTSPEVLQTQINSLSSKLSHASQQIDVLRGQNKQELAREHMQTKILAQNHSLIEGLRGQVSGVTVQLQEIKEKLKSTGASKLFDFSRFQYPWDWARQVAPANPEGYLHYLGDRAVKHGHRVVWIKQGFLGNGNLKEILQVDGTTNTQKVLQIISQYR